MSRVGIVSWGAYIPKYRIRTEEVARIWGDDPLRIVDVYLVDEKSVEGIDEDAVTIAVEAARRAIKRAGIDPRRIGVVYAGTESKPYAVKPISSILVDALGLSNNVFAVDMEFACKAGSEGLVAAMGLVESGRVEYGMTVGTDTSQGEPGEHLEYSASSGGAALVVGRDGVVAELEAVYSYVSDTPDFWRREGSPYPMHGEGFTGEPAYFRHIIGAAKGLMERHGYKPSDFTYVVFHQPNGRFPVRAASMLNIPMDKVKPGIVVTHIGNTYNASALMGFAKVLDSAKPGDKILLVPFGSGAGSNAFVFTTTDLITERQKAGVPTVEEMLRDKIYVDYAQYLKMRKMIKLFD
ncbi:hydroxymethylglutaryl-CoA synthase [Pyrobaculum ferrireducens]|uniref:Hydroxymethylglutaryl-CoA synthase n=1 Tax=Pyrobaculum ferrireducens TaxID=1104324 RepID=G7VGG5_9CREN|nr:hydroxymethylglutaryl-CoA synthase [Pyrobaculum ferrireducens]AET31876.1 putative hydroxymethylglutaryl-CoA synthase [Pyrobaculum ferrireducens]